MASLLTSHLFETADALVCLLELTAQHLVALLHALADLSLALNFTLDCLNVILCHSSISQAHLLVVDRDPSSSNNRAGLLSSRLLGGARLCSLRAATLRWRG